MINPRDWQQEGFDDDAERRLCGLSSIQTSDGSRFMFGLCDSNCCLAILKPWSTWCTTRHAAYS
jgi:hypothetical protein